MMWDGVICRLVRGRRRLVGSYYLTIRRRKHVYKASPITLSQLEDELIDSAHRQDGLIVVNKPVGVSFERGLREADSLNVGKYVSISNALPLIQRHFNITHPLHNLIIPERDISGVCAFCESESLMKEIKKWMRANRERRELAYCYHAIVVGVPVKHEATFDGNIAVVTKNGVKQVVLSQERNRNLVKRGDVKRVTLQHSVEGISTTTSSSSSGGDMSLVRVSCSTSKRNAVRAYLARESLTPVLGDDLFNRYVETIFGVATPRRNLTTTTPPDYTLGEGVIKRLELEGRRDVRIPLHLHLSAVTLQLNKREKIELTMPHPPIFLWTLRQLGLTIPSNHQQHNPLALAQH